MELNVVWAIYSEKEYINTLTYVRNEFGIKAAYKLKGEVDKWISRISKNSEIAAQEELLVNEPILYRSVIVGKYNKVVYKYDEENIYVSDFWDMRREPSKLARRVKRK